MKLLFAADPMILDLALSSDHANDKALDFLEAAIGHCHSLFWLSSREQLRHILFRRRYDKGSPLHRLVGTLNRVAHSAKFRFQAEATFPVRVIVVVADGGQAPSEGDWISLSQALQRAQVER